MGLLKRLAGGGKDKGPEFARVEAAAEISQKYADEEEETDLSLGADDDDDFQQGMQEVEKMKAKYEGLLASVESAQEGALGFASSTRSLASCLVQSFEGMEESSVGEVFLHISEIENEIAQLVDKYAEDLGEHVGNSLQGLLTELLHVEMTRSDYEEKRKGYSRLLRAEERRKKGRSGKRGGVKESEGDGDGGEEGKMEGEGLQAAKEEFDEIAMTLGCRIWSLQQRRTKSLLTQAVRFHTSKVRFFRQGMQQLQRMEPLMRDLAIELNLLGEVDGGGGGDANDRNEDEDDEHGKGTAVSSHFDATNLAASNSRPDSPSRKAKDAAEKKLSGASSSKSNTEITLSRFSPGSSILSSGLPSAAPSKQPSFVSFSAPIPSPANNRLPWAGPHIPQPLPSLPPSFPHPFGARAPLSHSTAPTVLSSSGLSASSSAFSSSPASSSSSTSTSAPTHSSRFNSLSISERKSSSYSAASLGLSGTVSGPIGHPSRAKGSSSGPVVNLSGPILGGGLGMDMSSGGGKGRVGGGGPGLFVGGNSGGSVSSRWPGPAVESTESSLSGHMPKVSFSGPILGAFEKGSLYSRGEGGGLGSSNIGVGGPREGHLGVSAYSGPLKKGGGGPSAGYSRPEHRHLSGPIIPGSAFPFSPSSSPPQLPELHKLPPPPLSVSLAMPSSSTVSSASNVGGKGAGKPGNALVTGAKGGESGVGAEGGGQERQGSGYSRQGTWPRRTDEGSDDQPGHTTGAARASGSGLAELNRAHTDPQAAGRHGAVGSVAGRGGDHGAGPEPGMGGGHSRKLSSNVVYAPLVVPQSSQQLWGLASRPLNRGLNNVAGSTILSDVSEEGESAANSPSISSLESPKPLVVEDSMASAQRPLQSHYSSTPALSPPHLPQFPLVSPTSVTVRSSSNLGRGGVN